MGRKKRPNISNILDKNINKLINNTSELEFIASILSQRKDTLSIDEQNALIKIINTLNKQNNKKLY